mmetsp:Transcript_22301/g.46207  ORF Transcript_22301/g.46207 Transcript_22301/m.46207 type:complete len:337 (+) Transcript_22301:189-1199(+)
MNMLSLLVVFGAASSLWSPPGLHLLVMAAGGADTKSASTIERTWSGIKEGLRFLRQTLFDDTSTAGRKRGRRRSTQIRLAVVGLGRTGSTSMYAALRELGYTPMHDNERLEMADLFGALFDSESPMPVDEFAEELGNRGFDSAMYYGYDFIQYCVDHNIKVVLTVRDSAEKWAESWLRVVGSADLLKQRPYVWSKTAKQFGPSFEYVMKYVPTAGRPHLYKDFDAVVAGYHAHYERVTRMVPPDLLLEFNVKQGWGPLCEFLQVPQPSTDFPHVNDKVVMKAVGATLSFITWIWPLFPLVLLFVLLKIGQAAKKVLRYGRNGKRRGEVSLNNKKKV